MAANAKQLQDGQAQHQTRIRGRRLGRAPLFACFYVGSAPGWYVVANDDRLTVPRTLLLVASCVVDANTSQVLKPGSSVGPVHPSKADLMTLPEAMPIYSVDRTVCGYTDGMGSGVPKNVLALTPFGEQLFSPIQKGYLQMVPFEVRRIVAEAMHEFAEMEEDVPPVPTPKQDLLAALLLDPDVQKAVARAVASEAFSDNCCKLLGTKRAKIKPTSMEDNDD